MSLVEVGRQQVEQLEVELEPSVRLDCLENG
jgi:hypothetical protein